MSQRSSAPVRALAATALVCGFLLVAVVIAVSLDGESGKRPGGDSAGRTARSSGDSGDSGGSGGSGGKAPKPRRAYVVQNGDTLTSISRETGVPVARILKMNPGVDPQILVSGQKLKLR